MSGPLLEVIEGKDKGKKFPLKNNALVGRGTDCDFVLSDLTCSRKHFQILRSANGFILKDLGSGNGTKVNGTKVREHPLQDGEIIKSGKTKLRFIHQRQPQRQPQSVPPGYGQPSRPPGPGGSPGAGGR